MIYLLLLSALVLAISVFYIAVLRARLILWKMEQDLEDWISYGTGMDIVRSKDQRREYQHYVQLCEKDDLKKLNIPASVIKLIRVDLRTKGLKSIYFKLLYLKLRGAKI